MCDKVATTDEHVPPRCLFPEAKEMDGIDLRKNLIKVPSCVEHNCEKSADDEFLMVSIAGIVSNNSIGYRHAKQKVERAVRRTSYKLLDKVFRQKELVRIEREDNKFIDLIVGTPDYARLASCFEKIAYGVYREHFGHRFNGALKLHLGFLHRKEKNGRTFNSFMRHKASLELANEPRYGENQKVFYRTYAKETS